MIDHNAYEFKYSRILLVCDVSHSHEWEPFLLKYANEVEYLSSQSYSGGDMLNLPSACVVIDGRIEDMMGAEMMMARNQQFFPPRPLLYIHDDRLTKDMIAFATSMHVATVYRLYDPQTVESDIHVFILSNLGYNPSDKENFKVGRRSHYSRTMMQLSPLIYSIDETDDIDFLTLGEIAIGLEVSSHEMLAELRLKLRTHGVGEEAGIIRPEIHGAAKAMVTANLSNDNSLIGEALKGMRRDEVLFILASMSGITRTLISLIAIQWETEPETAWQTILKIIARYGD